jgi:hypothetical protein
VNTGYWRLIICNRIKMLRFDNAYSRNVVMGDKSHCCLGGTVGVCCGLVSGRYEFGPGGCQPCINHAACFVSEEIQTNWFCNYRRATLVLVLRTAERGSTVLSRCSFLYACWTTNIYCPSNPSNVYFTELNGWNEKCCHNSEQAYWHIQHDTKGQDGGRVKINE